MAKPDVYHLCRRCKDSGLIAVSTSTLGYVCAGPVPEDARGVAEAYCDCALADRLRDKERTQRLSRLTPADPQR